MLGPAELQDIRHHPANGILVRLFWPNQLQYKVRKEDSAQPFEISSQSHQLHIRMLVGNPATNVAVRRHVAQRFSKRHLAQTIQRKVRRHIGEVDGFCLAGRAQVLAPNQVLELLEAFVDFCLHARYITASVTRGDSCFDVVMESDIARAEHAVSESVCS